MSTYYVRSSGGSDSNTGLSFAQGFATVQKGINTAVNGGDIIFICNDGIHTPTSYIATIVTSGTTNNYVLIKGVSATGIDDGSISTITGTGFSSGAIVYHNSVGSYKWENVRFTEADDSGFVIGPAGNNSKVTFINCRFDNAKYAGFFTLEENEYKIINFIGCEFDSNNTNGIEFYFPTYGNDIFIYNCKFHDNIQSGIVYHGLRFMIPIYNCLFYNNGTYGFLTNQQMDAIYLYNCIFDNNTNGIGLGLGNKSQGRLNIMNNIFSNNSQYGIYLYTTSYIAINFDYNCFYNNTSGHINYFGGIPPGDNNVLSNPLYVSTTPGSENYTLQVGSPCINSGYGYNG